MIPERIAYVKTDPHEDPEILQNLSVRLQRQGIRVLFTEQPWNTIQSNKPFLYFRNPYVRFDNERAVIDYHLENPTTCYITTSDGELVSVGTVKPTENCSFVLRFGSYYHEPEIEPLPILIGAHRRPLYFQLALNSVLYNVQSARQRVYIVASQPDAQTKQIIESCLVKHPHVEAVLTNTNLGYAFANFGSKFFDLPKFIHLEDDGILPGHLHYKIPFWTSQLHYRSGTADWVSHRVSDINYESRFYTSDLMYKMKQMEPIPKHLIWSYQKSEPNVMLPVGGHGAVIDCQTMYRDFGPPNFCQTDHTLFQKTKLMCIVNIPIYHIGANQFMDYNEYSWQKHNWGTPHQLQKGINMRTKQEKEIDLAIDWAENHARLGG